MENIFENAYFGKPYKTRDGRKAIYHGTKKHRSSDGKVWIYHYLMVEPTAIDMFGEDVVINHYDAYFNDNGVGRFANLKYYKDSGANAKYDIISEWQEEINKEVLDKLANEYVRTQFTEDNVIAGYCRRDFKAGIHAALEYLSNK